MLAGKRQSIVVHSNMIKVEIKGPTESKIIDWCTRQLGDIIDMSPQEISDYWDGAEIAEIERLNKIVFAYLIGVLKKRKNSTD